MGNEDTKELIQWHSGFRGAIKTELADSKDILYYEDEKSIGKKELKIDLLIIKKTKNVMINNPIGYIFTKHNLLEYKSPDDYLSINDFYKVYAYACLYKSYEDKADPIGIDEITLSFVLSSYPRDLVKHLRDIRKYELKHYYAGIYYVIGDILPIQIIITSKLNGKEHRWLRILTNKLTKDQIEDVLSDYEVSSKDMDKDAVIDIVTKANNRYLKKWKEGYVMSNELRKLFEPEIKQAVEQGVKQGIEQAVEQAIEQAVEQAVEQAEKKTTELNMVNLIRKKIQKKYAFMTIAEHLELDMGYVEMIANLIYENPDETDEGITKLIRR